MYIKLKNGVIDNYPYSYHQLKQDNKDTSFPESMPNERLAEWEVYPVIQTSQPPVDYTKNVIEDAPALIDDKWIQQWLVTDKPASEINEIHEELRAEAYRNESDPLFFKWQRGEATEQEWLDKIAEIKLRYPKV
jgi:hypothetical protein